MDTETASSRVHPPLRADGLLIRNAHGVVVASATHPDLAAALAVSVNSATGTTPAKRQEAESAGD